MHGGLTLREPLAVSTELVLQLHLLQLELL
jgi:hypothetical protein